MAYASIYQNNPQTKETVEVLELEAEPCQLIVFNDDVNTFEHVIQTLMSVCDHTVEQADQCAHIIHYRGKCVVKLGPFEKLAPMCSAITDRGISATVDNPNPF
jgi:ATP-dependent Clp protease adaptor protein ClpS